MIATVTVQHPHKAAPQSNTWCSRDSNQAGAPLPIIPRRTTRSQSLPISQSSTERPIVSLPPHEWSQKAVDSDSSSSSSSEASKATTRPRRKRARGVHIAASSSPTACLVLSPLQYPTETAGQACQRHTEQGVISDQSGLPALAAPRPLVYTPGMLRFCLETIRSHMLTGPHSSPHDPRVIPGNGSKSAPPQGSDSSEGSPPVIRKKSGQPVKSSLKSSRCGRANLSVVTIGLSSKSEPPTPKVVHFDPQLERVKLFLAEQKPLAVSRDGSPTEDTSGTDSDFPSFIYGNGDNTRRSRKKLVMRPLNMVSKSDFDVDVVLEDFYLNFDGTNILGKIRVRNVAYTKLVVVRFTFDSWQTTSEVTARYAESINSQFDRFSFSIRLNDLLSRIEGKTLVMAVRYNVADQEFWDNNYQQNYVATFTKAKVTRENKKPNDGDASDVKSLRSRLENVALHGGEKPGNPVVPPKPTAAQSEEMNPPSLKSGIALSSRYDFATSLRNSNTRKPTDVLVCASSPRDTRSLSPPSRRMRPTTDPALSCSIPWPEKQSPPSRPMTLPASLPSLKGQPPLVSPRDFDEERLFIVPCISSDKQSDVISLNRGRNHRRGHSLDADFVGLNSALRRTPPGTPPSNSSEMDGSSCSSIPSIFSSSPSSSRHHSFPPLIIRGGALSAPRQRSFGFNSSGNYSDAGQTSSPPTISPDFVSGLGLSLGESSGDSELSTPNLSTPTSSPTPSPMGPFMEPALPPLLDHGLFPDASFDMSLPMQPVSPGTHYRHFLNKFCFFTGPSPTLRDGTPNTKNTYGEGPPRYQSDSPVATDSLGPSTSLDDLDTTHSDSNASTPIIPLGGWSGLTTPAPS
ncbi:hypothetical protein D9756_009014 [Leucocoprinus leucothites]|uniref:CBM21 domain-containing protein n=1 Tax=Leucocoprinus leucothites TaxID=201217 RepID=A0A8H5FTX5_9AGAR|nr:hypothetical protein D9756_009014 [Leucoagaricus leucothites]